MTHFEFCSSSSILFSKTLQSQNFWPETIFKNSFFKIFAKVSPRGLCYKLFLVCYLPYYDLKIQCDQMKVLGNRFSFKKRPKCRVTLGTILKNVTFQVETALATFGPLL